MQGEKKKAKSRGGKGENEQIAPDRADRIDEYNFFLAQDEETREEVDPEEKTRKAKRKDRNKSLTFFLSE